MLIVVLLSVGNIHINDFFYHIKRANLNAYADDEQLYSSDKDLKSLNTWLEHELGIANDWYERNGMFVHPEKHQAMVLGANSNNEFSFPVKNSIDLLGVTIDKDLSFNRHISQICEKVNKQCSVLKSRPLHPMVTFIFETPIFTLNSQNK